MVSCQYCKIFKNSSFVNNYGLLLLKEIAQREALLKRRFHQVYFLVKFPRFSEQVKVFNYSLSHPRKFLFQLFCKYQSTLPFYLPKNMNIYISFTGTQCANKTFSQLVSQMFQSNKNWKCHITDKHFVTNNVNNNVNQTLNPLKNEKNDSSFLSGPFPTH